MSSEDRPLSRWSRRKAEARRKRGSAAPAIEDAPQAAVPADPPTREDPDAPPPDLPDVESLTAESDFAAFMKEGVPKQLRTLALRKLWTSDPTFNVIDEMIEYGEDFTDSGALIANLKNVLEDGKEKARKLPGEEEAPEAAEGTEPSSTEAAPEPGGTDADSAANPDAEDERSDPAV